MTNMFQAVKTKNVTKYIASVAPERKDAIVFLHKFIQKNAPQLKSHFTYNMLGYGKFKYKNYKNEIVDWPVVALANQKNYISLYICALEDEKYIAEKYAAKLGKVSVGKSCIRFKKLSDLNLEELRLVLQKAAESPGLILQSN